MRDSRLGADGATMATSSPRGSERLRTPATWIGGTTAAREQLGLPNVPWHYLRHFAATALLEAEQDLFVVSRILDHASVSTTANFYRHVQPVMLRRSADAMDELIRKASGN